MKCCILKQLLLVVALSLVAFSIVPGLVRAQEYSVILLEPSLVPGATEDYVARDGNTYTRVTSLGEYLNGIFILGIGLASALAVITLTYGGVQYMVSASIGKKDLGREKMTAAFWGLILALASWALLNTINPDLLKFRITEAINAAVGQVEETRVPVELPEVASLWPPSEPPTEEFVREQLLINSGGRVTVKPNTCRYIPQPSCTAVWGLGFPALTGLPMIAQKCNCPFVVTGGTEYWIHSTHGIGKSIVDLRPDKAGLERYLLGAFPGVGRQEDIGCPGGSFARANHPDGFLVQWEPAGCNGTRDSHWHIVF